MNGYALVRAQFPSKVMSPHIYVPDCDSPSASSISSIQAMIMTCEFHSTPADDEDGVEYEEEEDEDDADNDSGADDNGNEVEDLPDPPLMPVILDNSIVFVPPVVANDQDAASDLDIVLNDNMFEFDHQWDKHRRFPHIQP